MSHWPIIPVVLPAVMGALIILWMRHDMLLQRVFGIAGTLAVLGVAIFLNTRAAGGAIEVYRLGDWPAPFGIVLVVDRMAALMLILTGVLALATQLYAIGSGWDRKGWHYHALWQFQLMGVNGAFLTGDAFNLFVFFEVLLIASYGLMIHGGGGMRLRAGVQYITVNLIGSMLFLAGLGVLYAVTGTLNMADMALRVANLPAEDTALLRTGAMILMIVFAVKAAIVPLHFWLPSTYGNSPGPSAALFAIMSKVGVYAIIRCWTQVFPQDTVAETLASDILMPAALVTLILGQLGVLGTRSLPRLAAFAAIASVGTLMIAVARFQPEQMGAALYYLLHSTLSTGALFLVVDLIAARRGGDIWLRPRRDFPQSGLTAALFFAVAIAVAGLPPLSGFVGKLLILDATRADPWATAIWSTVLITSLVAIVGFARAGSTVFWKSHEIEPGPLELAEQTRTVRLETDEVFQDARDSASPALAFGAVGLLLALLVAMTAAAGPLTENLQRTADQLFRTGDYIQAVLVDQEDAR